MNHAEHTTGTCRPRRVGRLVLSGCLLLMLAACMTPARDAVGQMPGVSPSGVRYVVVRHAEKGNDDPKDPALTEAGLLRAQRLADSLADDPVVAVYSTAYRRTRDTAGPTALRHGLEVTAYDAREEVESFTQGLRQRYPAGMVLIVGHSNTVPGIVASLCDCEVASIDEDEYDHRFIVAIDADGSAQVEDVPLLEGTPLP